jgi:small-conductance mechanosensitive channel
MLQHCRGYSKSVANGRLLGHHDRMSQLWEQFHTLVNETLGISPAIFDKLSISIVTIFLALLLRWGFDLLIHRRVEDLSRRYVFLKTIHYGIGFVVCAIVLRAWLGGVTGLATYFGLLSAGIALALQDPLTNFAGWIFLSTCKPFAVGDRIQIGEHAGDVIDISLLQFTIIETGNWVDADQSTGRIIHLPNGWVFKHPQSNYTQGFNFIWNEIPVTVTFESDWEKAKQILTEIAERHSAIQTERAAKEVRKAARKYMILFSQLTPIVWTSVADIGVTLTIRYLCDPRKRRSTAERIWEEILKSFARQDTIDFAYPTLRYYDNKTEGKRQGVKQSSELESNRLEPATASSEATGNA